MAHGIGHCVACKWWGWVAEEKGTCRRRAPVVIGGLHGPSEDVWPETDESDWCGEYEPGEPNA